MTDHDDDDQASGVPERSERYDSGGHLTESGRHVTNRNVVPRSSMPHPEHAGEPAGDDAVRGPSDEESFDDVTPVRPPRTTFDPPPRDVFEAVTPRRGQPRDVFEAVTPLRAQPRGVYGDSDPAGVGPAADDDPVGAGGEPAGNPAGADGGAGPVRTSERWPQLVLHDADTPAAPVAPAPVRPSERRSRLTPEPRRASTEPGHVEPRRRPTTTPPGLRADDRDGSSGASGSHRLPAERSMRREPGHGATRDRTPRAASDVAVSPLLDRVLRVATIVAVFGLGAAGLAQPTSVLRGGIAWLVFLFFVLDGWGAIVTRLANARDPDAGLRIALGAAGFLALAGVLVAAGVLTRPVILALICLGFVGFAWREATAQVARWQRIGDGLVFIRARPALGVLASVLVLLACVQMLGAVAALDRNPWDDDLAYLPFVTRLLDTGDLVEPFSYRRLGAYGGQTALQALGAARGTLANPHLIDRGLALGIVLLLVIGYARERRTQPLWLALIALVLLLLPELALNTASYWTGVVAFFALYRCVAREQWVLAGLVAGAAATLRQNFIATIALFLVAVLVFRLVALTRTMPLREAWHQERRACAQVAGIALAVIVPWCVAAYLSSHTFLFPLVGGTWNDELSLRPAVITWPQKLALLVTYCLDTAPLVVIPILAVVVAFVTDRRLGRPLSSLVIATVLGFVVLGYGFIGIEAPHLWRYAFGFATALAIVLVLELGDDEQVSLAPVGRWLLLAALVLQIAAGRAALPKQAVALFNDLREAAAIDRHGDPNALAEQRRYAAMQAALPAGEPVIVMLDDPALLDFRRNPIANLDVPGLASPDPQLPAFRGAEAWREYLVAQGYRYAAFVRSERSRYHFRRGFWVWRIFNDAELFQIMSAYTIDAIDSLTELATTTRVLYDSDGLVVLDLASPLRDASRRAVRGDEPSRRSEWARELADREGLRDAWSLTTRSDLRFEDGFGGLRIVDRRIDEPRWYEIAQPGPEPAKRGQAILPLHRRAHIRVRGTGDMRLTLRAAIALNTVHSQPRLDVSLDGALLASAVADTTGKYAISVIIPGDRLTGGWHDLYLVFSSFAEPGKDVRDPRIARLESVEWSPP